MNSQIKKVITASAGTGKTYRLSLEYINLILRFKSNVVEDFKSEMTTALQNPIFEEILVITFTRKATAEIRENIFSHLRKLTSVEGDSELVKNLKKYCGYDLASEDIVYLKNVYSQMMTNKHKLKISTIDSFTNSVFKTIIAPYMGITDYEVNNEVNDRYLPLIFDAVMKNNHIFKELSQLFEVAGRKRIEDYDNLLLSIINNRWLFHLIGESNEKCLPDMQTIISYRDNYISGMKEIISQFLTYLKDDGKEHLPAKGLIIKSFLESLQQATDVSIVSFLSTFESRIDNEDYLRNNWKLLIGDKSFWNGQKCMSKKAFRELKEDLNEQYKECASHLANYLYCQLFLREEKIITELAEFVHKIYDELKLRDKVFTYSDIAYYTFSHLYDPELSLIDTDETVLNRFYEYLATNIRFMLIDEYQDTSIIQHKIILPIILEILSGQGIKDHGGVIIVGDEKQSIYGWRAGERDLLLKIGDIIRTGDRPILEVSYRSTQFIMNFINKIFGSLAVRIRNLPKEMKLSWYYDKDIDAHDKSYEGYVRIAFDNYSAVIEESQGRDSKAEIYHRFVEQTILPPYRTGELNLSDSVVLARYNSDLQAIADVLEEYNIDYFLESSRAIHHHPVITPIIYLLRYIVYRRIYNLLEFLRSDYCLLEAKTLKTIIEIYNESNQDKQPFLKELKSCFPTNDIIGKVITIVENSVTQDPMSLLAQIIAEFNVTNNFPQEHNVKNLHFFVETTSLFFKQKNPEYSHDLIGLIHYLDDNENNESLKQQSIEKQNSIQLMTIHKSKGLDFETVFTYLDLTRLSRGNFRELSILPKYNEKLTHLADYDIGYNYSPMLKIARPEISNEQRNKKLIEEINNIYVALTRAKKNILLYVAYRKKDGLQALIEEYQKSFNADSFHVGKEFILVLKQYLDEQGNIYEQDDSGSLYESGKLIRKNHALNDDPEDDNVPYDNYLRLDRTCLLKERDLPNNQINMKSVYLTTKQPLVGELVHYYLSHIKYGDFDELETASANTIRFYGNLFPLKAINDLISRIKIFIDQNPDIFSRSWDKVFTERTVFNPKGKEYRIDRLMINVSKKKVLIIDYKTGQIDDSNQLNEYKRVISELSFVEEKNYQVDGRYVDVKV